MSLFYNRIQRINPMDPTASRKWFPVLKSIGTYNDDDVSGEIAEITKLTPKEAETALYQFQEVLIKALLSGKTVKLAKLGTFRLTLNTVGSDTKEEVTHQMIKKVNVRFSPSDTFKERVAKARFSMAVNIVTEE